MRRRPGSTTRGTTPTSTDALVIERPAPAPPTLQVAGLSCSPSAPSPVLVGGRDRLVVPPAGQPARATRRPRSPSPSTRATTVEIAQRAAARTQGFITNAGVFRVVRRAPGRPRADARLLPTPPRRPHGQPDARPAHAARPRPTPRSPSPRASPSTRWRTRLSGEGAAPVDDRLHRGRHRRHASARSCQPDGVTSLEGLLFPDTYQVSNGETRDAGGRADGRR